MFMQKIPPSKGIDAREGRHHARVRFTNARYRDTGMSRLHQRAIKDVEETDCPLSF